MIEDLPDVPPVLVLLREELSRCSSLEEMRARVNDMLPELRDQAEVFERRQVDRGSDSKQSGRFEVHLDGELDLLAGRGCLDLRCRLAAAQRIAQSVGLVADRVWITDLLTERFLNVEEPTTEWIDAIISDVQVLTVLFPLISAGVVRFRSPWVPTCTACLEHFYATSETLAERLIDIFAEEFVIEPLSDGGFSINTGTCREPSIVYQTIPKNQRPDSPLPEPMQVVSDWIHNELTSAFWKAREAALTGGAVFSNSRVGLAGMLEQEGQLVDRGTLALRDKRRAFTIPWVSELNPRQIVQLREEIDRSLPRFRELVAQALSAKADGGSPTAPEALLLELRTQAAEVRAELEVIRNKSARYWKTTYGLLGVGLSIYGIGADDVSASATGLLPLIHLLIEHKTGQEAEVAKLRTKPGYVLVKAQDLLAHEHFAG